MLVNCGSCSFRVSIIHKKTEMADGATVNLSAGGPAYIVLRGAADAAGLALYALPLVRAHGLHHVGGELQTRGVTCG